MQQAAEIKGAMPADTSTEAQDTVSTDRGTFQWNPATGRYDIPV